MRKEEERGTHRMVEDQGKEWEENLASCLLKLKVPCLLAQFLPSLPTAQTKAASPQIMPHVSEVNVLGLCAVTCSV